MYIIGAILGIFFIISYPQFCITIIGIVIVGILFRKYTNKFYFNLFVLSIVAFSILEVLQKDYYLAKLIYDGIKKIGTISGLTNYYNSQFISTLFILSIVITLLDIVIVKLYHRIKLFVLRNVAKAKEVNLIKANEKIKLNKGSSKCRKDNKEKNKIININSKAIKRHKEPITNK